MSSEIRGLEIGMAYRKGAEYFICVDEFTLLTFRKGQKKFVTPQNKLIYHRQPSVSADEVANAWNVELAVIDAIFREAVKPARPKSAIPRVRPPKGAHERELEVYKCFFAKSNGFRYNG